MILEVSRDNLSFGHFLLGPQVHVWVCGFDQWWVVATVSHSHEFGWHLSLSLMCKPIVCISNFMAIYSSWINLRTSPISDCGSHKIAISNLITVKVNANENITIGHSEDFNSLSEPWDLLTLLTTQNNWFNRTHTIHRQPASFALQVLGGN